MQTAESRIFSVDFVWPVRSTKTSRTGWMPCWQAVYRLDSVTWSNLSDKQHHSITLPQAHTEHPGQTHCDVTSPNT